MNIIIYRRRFSRWGVDGTLVIKGVKVCNTLEHPERLLPAGEYKIALLSVVMNKDKKESGKKSQLSKKMPIILRDHIFRQTFPVLLISCLAMVR